MENVLQPMIVAQKVRIFPYSQYDRTVCMRAELIGCAWDGEFDLIHHIFFVGDSIWTIWTAEK